MATTTNLREGRPEPSWLRVAVFTAVCVEAVALLFVARRYYLDEGRSGLPLTPLLCVILTAGVVYCARPVEDGLRRSPTLWARVQGAWYFLAVCGFFLIGGCLPVALGALWPVPILQGIPPAVGAAIMTAPGVVFLLVLLFRLYQSYKRGRPNP